MKLTIMNTHRQSHGVFRRTSFPCVYNLFLGSRRKKYISVCQVDRFFEQPQNKNSLGWLDTSPASASTPSAESHISPVDSGKARSDMSDDDLFETTVSRRCQTLAEVSALAKSLHQPTPSEYEDVEPVEPAVNEPSNAD